MAKPTEPTGCRKKKYQTESIAADVARGRAKQAGIPLYWYPCPACLNWHLTKIKHTPGHIRALKAAVMAETEKTHPEAEHWSRKISNNARNRNRNRPIKRKHAMGKRHA